MINDTVGRRRIPNNFKSFWDKNIKHLIKERREVNRLKRKVGNSSPIFDRLNALYKVRKSRVQQAIKTKQHQNETKMFF